jgi:hypothetical protein
MSDIESLCNDGEMLDGLVKRFEERVAKGMKFGHVLTGLTQAKAALDQRMNLAADVMDAELSATAARHRHRFRYRVTGVYGCMESRLKVGDVLLYDEYKGERKYEELVDTKSEDWKPIGGWDIEFIEEKK